MLMTEATIDVKDHPILITLRDTISGNGFLVRVTISGRTLMRQEDGKWWMYGVRPAALAESGCTVNEAFLRFRQAYTEVLFDIAQDSKNFDEFRSEVERFFNEGDGDEKAWEGALKSVRYGHTAPTADFSNLPRQSPDARPVGIEVVRLDGKIKPSFTPGDNVTATYSIADKQAA